MDEEYIEDLKLDKGSDPFLYAPSRKFLPILRYKLHILYLIEQNNVVIIAGETGSGKSTRNFHLEIPRFLYEAGWDRKIAVILSRRIGAVSLCAYLSKDLPHYVGYKIRFDSKITDETRIVYMTDGVLMREIQRDPLLHSYSVLIFDDVHERTTNMDLLLGLSKKILIKRPELRLIVTSATLDAELYLSYFNEFKVQAISIEGRLFPVDIYYLTEPCKDYIEKAVETVLSINTTQPPGDVLVFLTGQEDIRLFVDKLTGKELEVLPLYAGMPLKEQLKVFDSYGRRRKVIAATNIAETAVTIEGIVYVVDCCFCKSKIMVAGVECLAAFPVSKAQAVQRAGRAGRIRPGKTYRLCTISAFEGLQQNTAAEILHCCLASSILYLKSLSINNLTSFAFLSPPQTSSVVKGLELLYNLSIIDETSHITQDIGKIISELPIDIKLAVMLLKSCNETFRCSKEMLEIVSMLSVQHIFTSKSNESVVATKIKIGAREGDHVTLLNIFENFYRINSFNERNRFCNEFRLNIRALNRACKIRDQLRGILGKFKLQVISCECDVESILRCLVTGLFCNAAQRDPSGVYRSLKSEDEFYLHPASVLNIVKPPWIVFTEVIQTDKRYLVDASEIDPDWLAELVPDYFADVRSLRMKIQHKKLNN